MVEYQFLISSATPIAMRMACQDRISNVVSISQLSVVKMTAANGNKLVSNDARTPTRPMDIAIISDTSTGVSVAGQQQRSVIDAKVK